MSNYLDIKIGKKLKLFNFKRGGQGENEWAFFNFTPYEAQANGTKVYGQKYMIIIKNIGSFGGEFHDGDSVEIAAIHSVTAEDSTYQKNGQNITTRVIKVAVDIKIEENNHNEALNNNYNSNNNKNNQQEYDTSFANDDYDVPQF